jgi:hypothetical protein
LGRNRNALEIKFKKRIGSSGYETKNIDLKGDVKKTDLKEDVN